MRKKINLQTKVTHLDDQIITKAQASFPLLSRVESVKKRSKLTSYVEL